MSKKWDTSMTLRFIDLYESHECLWDTKHPFYKNRDARVASLKSIADSMQIPSFGVLDVKNKIRSIRNVYGIEANKIRKSRKSGCGLYKPQLVWFQRAKRFLEKSRDIRETPPNSPSETDDQMEIPEDMCAIYPMENHYIDCAPSIEVTPSILEMNTHDHKRRAIIVKEEYVKSSLDKLDDLLSRANEPIRGDQYTCLGNFIAESLRNVPIDLYVSAEGKILQIIHDTKVAALQNQRKSPPPH